MDETTLAPAPTPGTPAPAPTDLLVDAWFIETFHNVAGLSTELFNRFSNARETLKARLRAKE